MNNSPEQQINILVVDDHPLMHTMLTQIIKQLGFTNVFLAENGDLAWHTLLHRNIGLVITDLNMPVLNGVELLKSIRNNPMTTHLPVIVISGEGVADKVREAIAAGADAFIVKPFSAQTVHAKIVQALNRFRDRLPAA